LRCLFLLVGYFEGAKNRFGQGKERKALFEEFRWTKKKELIS